MNKEELLDAFKKLNSIRFGSINCTPQGMLLCKGLRDISSGYWLLNKEVTEQEFNEAKETYEKALYLDVDND